MASTVGALAVAPARQADGALASLPPAVPAAYVGLWRRRVIHRASGISDTSTRVWWCQSARFHIDLRIPAGRPALTEAAQLAGLGGAPLAAFGAQIAFAGTTVVDGARCEWRSEIAFPQLGDELDAGLMRFDAPDRLHEAGLDGSYTEDWERADAGPVAGLRLVAADGGAAVAYLLVAADWLAFARGTPALAYARDAPDAPDMPDAADMPDAPDAADARDAPSLADAPDARAWSEFFIAERSGDGAHNARWTITASNSPWREGASLFDAATPELASSLSIAIGELIDLSPHGSWRVAAA